MNQNLDRSNLYMFEAKLTSVPSNKCWDRVTMSYNRVISWSVWHLLVLFYFDTSEFLPIYFWETEFEMCLTKCSNKKNIAQVYNGQYLEVKIFSFLISDNSRPLRLSFNGIFWINNYGKLGMWQLLRILISISIVL